MQKQLREQKHAETHLPNTHLPILRSLWKPTGLLPTPFQHIGTGPTPSFFCANPSTKSQARVAYWRCAGRASPCFSTAVLRAWKSSLADMKPRMDSAGSPCKGNSTWPKQRNDVVFSAMPQFLFSSTFFASNPRSTWYNLMIVRKSQGISIQPISPARWLSFCTTLSKRSHKSQAAMVSDGWPFGCPRAFHSYLKQ